MLQPTTCIRKCTSRLPGGACCCVAVFPFESRICCNSGAPKLLHALGNDLDLEGLDAGEGSTLGRLTGPGDGNDHGSLVDIPGVANDHEVQAFGDRTLAAVLSFQALCDLSGTDPGCLDGDRKEKAFYSR